MDDATANAREIVTRPDRFHRHPAVIQNAWALLKAERGQPVHFDRLGQSRHLVGADSSSSPAAEIEAARRRALPRIRARAAQLGLTTGGDDAA